MLLLEPTGIISTPELAHCSVRSSNPTTNKPQNDAYFFGATPVLSASKLCVIALRNALMKFAVNRLKALQRDELQEDSFRQNAQCIELIWVMATINSVQHLSPLFPSQRNPRGLKKAGTAGSHWTQLCSMVSPLQE
ncbi:hypothetical protein [Acidovorax sp. Root219]|uniref:hypothetical protein n=1 Tax=Acidovorax sp. Root219 TaxID=1736493 RepID=UPI00138F206B|nr:hypothetical protein [Acidovorax sp. Root219]